MSQRKTVSALQNIFFDAQQVDAEDLSTEQEYVDQITSALVHNHLGTGVLPSELSQNVLFDSSKVVGTLDGKPIDTQSQPSDTAEGNQLEVELLDSKVSGRRRVKVAIIGLDFNGNLQFDTFYFSRNEKQYTTKHYTQIISILFNDILGDTRSFNLGGQVVIREATPFTLARDTIMVSQDVEPNLFFRDFFLDSSYFTLTALLQAAAAGYNIDSLGVSTGYRQIRKLNVNDVTTQIGQKFLAKTNNIQKITLLMGVENSVTPSDLTWAGDFIVSIYALQSSVQSPSDIVPELAIDFPPSNLPVAQISFNYSSLQDEGVVLDGYLQPVDFVFSNTPVANGGLTVDSYYAVTVKRSGSANKCNLLFAVGNDRVEDSHITIFNGSTWTDIPEEDLWFQVWTDAAKVTDGQAYENGAGVQLPKTNPDAATGATVDYALDKIPFSTTLPYYAHLKAVTEESVVVQDQRTGDDIFSRKKNAPEVELLTSTELEELQENGNPLVLGSIQDKNVKSIDVANDTVSSSFYHFGFFKDKVAIKLNEDSSDPNNNLNLLTALLNGDLTDAKFVPNTAVPSLFYRIANASVRTLKWGDVNGDGVVDEQDAALAAELLGETLVTSPTMAEYDSSTNYFTTENPVSYVAKIDGLTVATSTGLLTVDSVDGTVATITDGGVDFSAISGILSAEITIAGASSENNGTFEVIALTSANVVQIKKVYRNEERILQVLCADINADGQVTAQDVTYIDNFASGVASALGASALPESRIGKPFRVLLLTLEEFVDRNDEYTTATSTRASVVHPRVDPATDGYGTLLGHDYSASPVAFEITKRLTWRPELVVTSSRVKAVPVAFTETTNDAEPLELGPKEEFYPVVTPVSPGRNDFYVPDNLIVGHNILTPQGDFYKVDYEVGTVILNIPTVDFTDEKSINFFTDFVADYNGDGTTRLGYPAMRFADGTFVENPGALALHQVRYSVAIQSFYPELDGLSTDGYTGVLVDDRMGVSIDQASGTLKLNFSHLKEDLTKKTLSTKVQVTVFLKKAGFRNNFIEVDSTKMKNLLGL